MRSFASAVVLAIVALTAALSAQAQQARALYDEVRSREAALRKTLDTPKADAALLTRLRTLVTTYEDIAKLFPGSPYSDNALWQGALLAADGYWQFGEGSDRETALRLLGELPKRFPTSTLAAQVPAQVARLAPRASQKTPAPPPSAATAVARPTRADARLTAVRREVRADVLRLSLELEREVSFTSARLDDPARVFIDLADTRAVDTLRDRAMQYPDDVVQQVRVGAQTGSRTRVVLDLRGAIRHSIYTMYEPYRIVVDFERPAPAAKMRPAATTPAVTPASAPIRGRSVRQILLVAPALPRPSGPTVSAPGSLATAPLPPAANTAGGFSLSRQLGLGVTRIVIDPGHGGHDPGAKVKGLTEADIVLSVGLKLEKLLLKQQGIQVVLTRRENTYVALEERTAIANRAGADMFLSIHANASANATTQGVETYFLNFASSDAAEAVAARENSASGRSMHDLPEIVKAIALGNKVDESRDLAVMVQTSLYESLGKTNRQLRNLGVKQAPFMVLIGATMPSVLAEIAFITNADEASRLKTEKYRQQIADALCAAVLRYQQSLKAVPAVARR
jgi:N-acetylmuramoyl-L-alanine amidase